ncbi:MAG TPA: MFS transporter [Magnetospirillaceae bacterium]|jgi:predicted MFS family arabinose efflux permease
MGSLLWLALGAFAVGTEGFMIAGLLPRIAADLGVSISDAGHLVTVFGITYAIGSPIIAVLTGSIERKKLMLGALIAFGVGNILAAISTGFIGLLASRAILALTAGTFMPAAVAYAATTVAPERRGQAISVVYTGFTLALVVGVPLGSMLGTAFGWRSTFYGITVLAALSWIGIAAALKKLPGTATVGLRARIAAIGIPGVPSILLLTILALAGAFSSFTYFAPLLHDGFGVSEHGVALFLLLFGGAAFVGNLSGGYVADHIAPRRALALLAGLLALAFAAIPVAAGLPHIWAVAVVALAVIIWGVAGWCFLPIQQARLAATAPTMVPVVVSLNGSAIYVGAALGSLLGGQVIEHGAVQNTGWVGVACAMVILLVLSVTGKQTRTLSDEERATVAAELEVAGME